MFILRGRWVRIFLIAFLLFFSVFVTCDYFFFQGPNNVDSYAVLVVNFSTVILVLIFFRQVLKDVSIIRLEANTEVWIALGLLLYCAGTLPLFLLFDYLIHQAPDLASAFFFINDALNIIMYVCFSIAYLCTPHYPM